jgi:tryptophan-rich sensory protein
MLADGNVMTAFISFAIIVGIGAFIGSRFKPDAWYRQLRKPAWTPPDWLFAPVWSVLYFFSVLAGWAVWWANADAWSVPLVFWAAQVVLNTAWSWLYFGRHDIFGALIDSALLFIVVLLFIATAHLYSPAASWLFVPYAIWVGFATFLNATIWHLNEGNDSANVSSMLKALMDRVMRFKPGTSGR